MVRDGVGGEPVSVGFPVIMGNWWENYAHPRHLRWTRQCNAMTSGTNEAAFPPSLPWEEFAHRRVTIDELRERTANMQPTLMLAHLADKRSPLLDPSAVADLLKIAAGGLDANTHGLLLRDLIA